MKTEFDHAVVIVQDRLQAIGGLFAKQGFTLSELAKHNLGTFNRLIVLNSSYLELLGWLPGHLPARKEVVEAAPGLEALVFRSEDAYATHARLEKKGFKVRPVEELTRPALFHGQTVQARFLTVRFEESPVPGIRIYFCQHITPEYIWREDLLHHANNMTHLVCITGRSADPVVTAASIAKLTDAVLSRHGNAAEVVLPNLRLRIDNDPSMKTARLYTATLLAKDGTAMPMDLTGDALFGH